MKIVIDLQCCQTEARTRGIGRYTEGHIRAIVEQGGAHDFVFLLNSKFLDQSEDIVRSINLWSSLGKIAVYEYPDVRRDWQDRVIRENIGNVLRNDRIESLSPDIFHASSLFEGDSVWGRALAYTALPRSPIIRSAILYDFVPLLYPKEYLREWPVSNWYKRTLAVARRLDVALAISDATKRDAERFLKLDPAKVANIYGGVDERFRILPSDEAHVGKVWTRLDPTQPFVLYLGGPDPRKNLDGALEAFAFASSALTIKYKFVVAFGVTDGDALRLRQKAGELGIYNSLVILGFVEDADLVELYNACSLFIFPSLYEGLGLPVIEAMRCGAPVLVGDNSSLKEIVTDPEFRFDASSSTNMAAAISRALTSPAMLAQMRSYSVQRSKDFTWAKSARATIDAWFEACSTRVVHSISAIQKRLPRIAMFTPLPPVRSGIADYSADFIPVLTRFANLEIFVEDISNVDFEHPDVMISHHTEFTLCSDQFDAVVYQIGNSPYHHYMLPYMQRFPGIAVIHDAYLGHLSHDPENPERFIRQVINDHGGAARAIIERGESDVAKRLIDEFTCSSTYVHRCKGIVVHSEFAKNLLVKSSNSLVAPRICVIPQYCARAVAFIQDKQMIRKELGLPNDVFVIATFGHIAPTKGTLELIAAFDSIVKSTVVRAHLVFVGELEGGGTASTPFARKVLEATKDRSDITITGYVNQRTYDYYLIAADIGVQLRTQTRGETSRAMMNLILNGVPFIHNRLGGSKEIPLEVALGIDTAEPSVVAEAIIELMRDHSKRSAFGYAAMSFAQKFLTPDVLGSRFVEEVLSMTKRAEACGPASVADRVALVLVGETLIQDLLQETSAAYVRQERCEDGPRLLIDVTHIRENDLGTGVQRVVRELTRAAYRSEEPNVSPQAFAFTSSDLTYADEFAQTCGARLPVEEAAVQRGRLIIRPFDRMLLADGSWHLTSLMEGPLEQLRAASGAAYGLVHDILPLLSPHLFPDHVEVSILKWLTLILKKGDGFICTSRTGADDLVHYIRKNNIATRQGFRIGCQPLGADFTPVRRTARPTSDLIETLGDRKHVFLMVGTIEPRKGHDVVLDAFDRLWSGAADITLLFVGKAGWNVNSLLNRIITHPQHGRNLFHLDSVDDLALSYLYEHSFGVIVASIAEGFGLPLYEAARVGTPLILSDIAVFKELAGNCARYFRKGSADSLFDILSSVLDGSLNLISSKSIPVPTWRESAEGIFEFIRGRNTYLTL